MTPRTGMDPYPTTTEDTGLQALPECFRYDAAWSRRALAIPLGPTHGGLVIDRAGLLYCSTDGPRSVIVFDPDGAVMREFAPELAGIHSLSLAEEGGEEFLVCAHLLQHRVVKLTLTGQVLWSLGAPLESGLYSQPGDFKPTAAVVAPDGSLFVADGYGASVIHQFDPQRRYVKSFGGAEAGPGQLRNCHGLTLDRRGPEPRLLVCDRRNRRLVHYDLDGRFAGVLAEGLRRPCSVAFSGEFLAVAELEGRVTILGRSDPKRPGESAGDPSPALQGTLSPSDGERDGVRGPSPIPRLPTSQSHPSGILSLDRAHHLVATVGDNPDPTQWAAYDLPPSQWRDGVCNAPHSVCFDAPGNLFISEWNATGRLTKLEKIRPIPQR